MKKIVFTLLICFLFSSSAFAIEENTLMDVNEIETETIEFNPDDKTILEEQVKKDSFKAKIDKYYSYDKGIVKLKLNDYLKLDFGIIGDMNFNISQEDNNKLHSNFYLPSADIVLSGRANKYIDYKAQVLPSRNIDVQTILGDVWVRGQYKNYSLQLGRMRKTFAYEPAHSLYDSEFTRHSQIANRFGDGRDTGVQAVASYKYADFATGLFANMQNRPFDFSNSGIEFHAWVTLKPLANYDNLGDLNIGGGVATGNKDYSYNNYAAYIKYNYKKFGFMSEYISKENASEINKRECGFYADATYFLTDKLQAKLRFDAYNPDPANQSRYNNEYTAGLNYYFNNKNIMMLLDYTYRTAEVNSQRIAIQMRYRTW